MKEITFNGKKYNTPTCWSDVTIKQVIQLDELSELMPDAILIALISAYVGIPVAELKSGNVKEVNDICTILGFIDTPYEPVAVNSFRFNGELYSTASDLTSHEFQDWLSIQTILYNNREHPVKGLARMLAVYCKKDGETLDDIDLGVREELFMGLPFTIAKSVESFFLHSLVAWKQATLLSLREEEMEKHILRSFDELSNTMKVRGQEYGFFSFTRIVIGIYRKYLMYLKRQLERYFSTTPSKP
jgi:hypothetical protein